MRTYPVVEKKIKNSEWIINSLLPDFPWVEKWSLQVSPGLVGVVGCLLADIEDILGANPILDFFKIIEDLDNDKSESYRRVLSVFIQPKGKKIEARDAAIKHVIERAAKAALVTCYACGDNLEAKNLNDEIEHRLYPFLPKPSKKDSHVINVCMMCASKSWKEKRQLLGANMHLLQRTTDADESEIMSKKGISGVDKPFDPFTATFEMEFADNKHGEDIDADELIDKINEVPEVISKDVFIPVFDIKDVNKMEAECIELPKDQANRIKGLVRKIRQKSASKRLAVIPGDWRPYCEELSSRFPNFAEVIDYVRTQLALSEAGNGVLMFPPILLAGDPGIGKTEFALTLANDMKSRLEVIDISSAQSGSVLTGSEVFWSNSQPGTVFNILVFGDLANPIVLLDEVDKARTDGVYKPLSGLHQLLEPGQSKKFNDISVPDLKIDASHVVWIATANNLDGIEKQILDRFKTFVIDNPSIEQMTAIAQNQYRNFLEKHPSGCFFQDTMSPEVLNELCKHHPRKVRQILDQSFGLAAYDCRNYLIVQDVLTSEAGEKRKQGIGFMSEIN